MKRRKLMLAIAGVLIVALAGIAALIWPEPRASAVLRVVGTTEPAAILDATGEEMLLVTLRLTTVSNAIYFTKDSGGPIEARVAGCWVPVEGRLGASCRLRPGISRYVVVLMPGHAQSCRFRVQYAQPRLSEARAWSLANRVPTWVPLHGRIRNWLVNSAYTPSGIWREINFELPLPQAASSALQ